MIVGVTQPICRLKQNRLPYGMCVARDQSTTCEQKLKTNQTFTGYFQQKTIFCTSQNEIDCEVTLPTHPLNRTH